MSRRYISLVVILIAAVTLSVFLVEPVSAQRAKPTKWWQGHEEWFRANKGFHVEMQPGPHPDPDPQGSVVHVAAIRGNTRNDQPENPGWIEFGFRYKPADKPGEEWGEQGCDCSAIFYGTNMYAPYPEGKVFDIGPAAPYSTHTFEFASNDAGGFEVWIDGILRTVLSLPPDPWTDWAKAAQTEIYHHMEDVNADFENEVFYHSPFRRNFESMIDPFYKWCQSGNGMPYRPGPRLTGGGRYHYHDGAQQTVCNE